MKNKLTDRQKINVELAARSANKKSTKVLKHHVPQEEREKLKIEFICECSNPDCQDHISLTLKEYEKLHHNFAHFVVAKGHIEPKIEIVKKTGKKLSVIEKYALS